MTTPVESVKHAIENRRAVCVVGTGVSVMATGNAPCASWSGLLEHGVAHCEATGVWQSDKDAAVCRSLIKIGRLLLAAQMVKDGVASVGPHAFQSWLCEALGDLPIAHPEILYAVHGLSIPLITLNYDALLERSSPATRRLQAITWRQEYHCIRFLKGEDREKVLHLHGYYDDAESVILDAVSYGKLLANLVVETLRNALSLTHMMLYVGCGSTFEDPHFEQFRTWIKELLDGMPAFHYRLVRKAELNVARKLHAHDGIQPLVYGERYEDLVPFLQGLAPKGRSFLTATPTPSVAAFRYWLPVRPSVFGRDRELAALVQAMLGDAPRPICVLGPPGYGKSSLSLAALHDPSLEARFGPRRFFVRLDEARTLKDMVDTVGRALGLQAIAGVSMEDSVLSELSRAPAALVVDNLETPWEPADQRCSVEEWLGKAAGLKNLVLVATVRGVELPGTLGWQEPAGRLTALDAPASKQLFTEIAREHVSDPELDALLELLGGWPLAIMLMAHQSRGEATLSAVIQRWRAEKTAMLCRGGAANAMSSLDVSLKCSMEGPRMTMDARHLLALLGELPSGVRDDDIELIGSSRAHAHQLVTIGLAIREAGRLRLLPIVREHVQAAVVPPPADIERLKAFFEELAGTLGDRVGGEDGAGAVQRLSAEVTNVEAFLRRGPSADPSRFVRAVRGWAAFSRFSGLGDYATFLAVADANAPTLTDEQRASLMFDQGRVALDRSDHDHARTLFERACPLYRRVGSVLGEANCIKSLGDIALHRSDHEQARALFERARPLYQHIGSVLGEANCVRSLGDIALERSDHEQARALFEQARPFYQRVGSTLGEANCIKSLGDIALHRSDHKQARALFEQARPLYQRVGDVQGEANCIKSLGEIAQATNEYDQAKALVEQACPLYQRIGCVLGEANCIRSLGEIAQARNDYDQARVCFDQALRLYRRIPEPYSIGWALRCLARVGRVEQRRMLVRDAAESWRSIDRADLINDLEKEFPDCV